MNLTETKNSQPKDSVSDFEECIKRLRFVLPLPYSLERSNLLLRPLKQYEYIFNFGLGVNEFFPIKVNFNQPKNYVLISHVIYILGTIGKETDQFLVEDFKASWKKIDSQKRPEYIPFVRNGELILASKIRIDGKINSELIKKPLVELLNYRQEIEKMKII